MDLSVKVGSQGAGCTLAGISVGDLPSKEHVAKVVSAQRNHSGMNRVTDETPTELSAPIAMGERLVAAGLLSARDLERARMAKREMGCMLGEALVRLGLVAEANVTKYLA